MSRLTCIFFLVLNRVFKALRLSVFFCTRYGIKAINPQLTSDFFSISPIGEKIELSSNQLIFPFDGLKDSYSLLGTPLSDSPHIVFMERLYSNKDFAQSEYFNRCRKGTIDMRYSHCLNRKKTKKNFQKKLELVLSDNYPAVKVTKIEEKYYVMDGKHTAALCHMLKKPIKCVLIPHPYVDSFFYVTYKMMLKSEKKYSKGIHFLSTIYFR